MAGWVAGRHPANYCVSLVVFDMVVTDFLENNLVVNNVFVAKRVLEKSLPGMVLVLATTTLMRIVFLP